MDKTNQLLQVLQEKKIIDAQKAEEIKKLVLKEKKDLSSFLINKGLIDEEELTKIKAKLYSLSYYNLADLEILESVLKFIPVDIAKTYKVVSFDREVRTIKVGMVEPNLKAMEAINFLAREEKLNIQYYLISLSSFKKAFKQYQKIEEEISSALEVRAQEDELTTIHNDESTSLDSNDINSAPISRIVAVIIRHAVEARASDIHIEPYGKKSRVRYRIDGILHTSLTLPKSIHPAVIARIKVLAKLKLDETRIPQDGRIRLMVNNREVDFRVSTLPLANQEKIVMRILDTVKGVPSLKELGFNNLVLRAINRGIKKTSGIVLVTGPTGSGKTTTLYSVLNILNKEGVNISTLEDPIEYEMKGINQSQVKPRIGFTFANGLRSLLRQDPNIIMVGEIRDEETAELSIHASLTGHLVLSTLHTNDSLGAIFRLLDMKIENFLLASTLKVVVAQRLARKLCEHCKQEINLTDEMKEKIISGLKNIPDRIIKEELPELENRENLNKFKFYKAVGCNRCENTGYSGRTAIAEVLEINDQLKEMINSDERRINMKAIQKTQDFITLRQAGIIKVVQGITTMEEVLRVIED